MSSKVKTVLITAFEPFGNETVNASAMILDALPDEIGGMKIEKALLPVVFCKAKEEAVKAYCRTSPDAVICLGQAGGRDAITPERVAINVMDARIADNEGNRPQDVPIEADGPAACFSTLPVKKMVKAMANAGVPARLSDTAGTFVCNDLMYGMLYELSEKKGKKDIPCGFIHVPYLQGQVPENTVFSIPLALAVQGIKAAVLCLDS